MLLDDSQSRTWSDAAYTVFSGPSVRILRVDMVDMPRLDSVKMHADQCLHFSRMFLSPFHATQPIHFRVTEIKLYGTRDTTIQKVSLNTYEMYTSCTQPHQGLCFRLTYSSLQRFHKHTAMTLTRLRGCQDWIEQSKFRVANWLVTILQSK